MENFQVYRDIQARTGGDIYIGVVGPVRTGKSTFIRRFMELVALPDMEPAKHYIIRVASDDLLYVEGEKDALMEKAGITGTIEVQEEKSLSEGDCIIETDNQMIDCGFRTQLDYMVRTLRMLV